MIKNHRIKIEILFDSWARRKREKNIHIHMNTRSHARNNITIRVYTCERASKKQKTAEKKSNTHQQPISMFINVSRFLCIINNVHDDRVFF